MEMITVVDHFVEIHLCIREVISQILTNVAEEHGNKLFDEASSIKTRYEEVASIIANEKSDWTHAHKQIADFLTWLGKELKYEPPRTLIDKIESWEGKKDQIKGLRNDLEESLQVFLELLSEEESRKNENLALLIPVMMYLLKLVQFIGRVQEETERKMKEANLNEQKEHEHSLELLQDSTSITDYKIAIAHLVPIFERVWFPMREKSEEYYVAGEMGEIETVYCMIYNALLTEKLSLTQQLALINKLTWVLNRYGKNWESTDEYRYSIDAMQEELEDQDLVMLTNNYINGCEYLYAIFKEERKLRKNLEDPKVLGIIHAALSLLALYVDALIEIRETEQDLEYEMLTPLEDSQTNSIPLDDYKIRGILRRLSNISISDLDSKTLDKRVKFGACIELTEG
ncbi:hypothetical protein Ciccas_000778 [Cichlidogyrus casuarinus]|uniref:Uncharacterized protein n=1 Tax=Cichlidogyrus casuarinus TaxID=1844966 RepID=A0ABD2QP66_9PLAT